MIRINGTQIPWTAPLTIEQFLVEQGFAIQRIAVERNGEIVKKACYATEEVKDGDVIEVVNFVGGG